MQGINFANIANDYEIYYPVYKPFNYFLRIDYLFLVDTL